MIHVRAIVGNYLNCRKIHQERNPIENFHEGQSMKIISHFSKITIISFFVVNSIQSKHRKNH